jgi:hypothetical protein
MSCLAHTYVVFAVPVAGFDNIEPLVAYDYNVYLMYWYQYFPRAVSPHEAFQANINQDVQGPILTASIRYVQNPTVVNKVTK